MLNSTRYPALDYNISLPRQQFSRAYGDAALFRSKFFNIDELVSNPSISPSDYKTLYPLFLFDVSKLDIKLVNDKEQAEKLSVKPNFDHCSIYSEELVAIHMKNMRLVFDKPVYLGMCILDLKCNSSPDKHVFLYLYPGCLCIIIHFSAYPTTIRAPGFVFIRTGVQTEKSN